jgi:hypothetical protein
VRLEVTAASRSTTFDVVEVGFLIGSVPGCDLRLAGADLPPLICLIALSADGASLRKLTPTQAVLVNGRPVNSCALANGDRISLRGLEVVVHIEAAPSKAEPTRTQDDPGALNLRLWAKQLEERSRQLDERQRQLEQQTHELEADRVIWYQRRQEIEQECTQQRQLRKEQEALRLREQDLDAAQQKVAGIRRRVYGQYRQRRDRLAGLQEAVARAAQKVQQRKRDVDAASAEIATRQQELAERQAVLDVQASEVSQARQALDQQRQEFEKQQDQQAREWAQRSSAGHASEQKLIEQQRALEQSQAQHQADLLRLDRLSASMEQRQKQLQARALEVDRRSEQLQRDSRELEEQALQVDHKHAELAEELVRLAQTKTEVKAAGTQWTQRTTALEAQQAMLATLRSRLERMREEVRRESQQLLEQRSRQEEIEADLQRRLDEAAQLREDLDNDRQVHEQERRRFEERAAVLDTAVAELRQAQEKLTTDEAQVQQRLQELDARAAAHAEEAALLRARSEQVQELQRRVELDRQALRERESTLDEAEQAREALQEQLRRRSEELVARQRSLAEQARQHEEAIAALAARRAEIDQQRQEAEQGLLTLREALTGQTAELDQQRQQLAEREEVLRQRRERLKHVGRTFAAKRKLLSTDRASVDTAQRVQAEGIVQSKAEVEAARQEVLALHRQLPELELRAQTAVDALTRSREQLREHLAELHTYARQSQADLETLRAQLQTEAEQLRQREAAVRSARDEQRLTVATFRQQLIDWQGQVAQLKRSLAHDETRLERRQAEVDEQARQVDATSARLAQQAQQLEQQQRVVQERRGEMERHLADMREWYRHKLRELAASSEQPEVAVPRDILTLAATADAGDRQLGDLLRSLGLVEAEPLEALLAEARRQRRSLRQVLLASGHVTLYQLALIEAGNLDGLVLGPVRVVDRLRMTPHETVYRVFDPRRGQEAILRHLAEAEMDDAIHPDEFRQRFRAMAAVQHPHLTATLEVLEISGRPAVLQEWLVGLPSSDWPPLAAVPGVWFRVLNQAALGVHTAHEAGLVHGRLQPSSILLTLDGTVKLSGFGEPPWLDLPLAPAAEASQPVAGDAAADLLALGDIAASWITRAARKAKPLPEPLQSVLRRLQASGDPDRYPTAAALLEELDRVGADVPPNTAAWERLLRQVREQLDTDGTLKRSA